MYQGFCETVLTTALQNLQAVTVLSRQSWKLILAETNNDREWLPNLRQKGVIPNAAVTQPMIDNWLAFMNRLMYYLRVKS